MKGESRFWARIRKKLSNGHIVRVENPVYPGTPDVNFCGGGGEVWFELKFRLNLPKLASTPVFRGYLKKEQVLWLKTRSFHGGNCYILAGVEDLIFCIPGALAEQFNDFTLEQLKQHNVPLEKVLCPSSSLTQKPTVIKRRVVLSKPPG